MFLIDDATSARPSSKCESTYSLAPIHPACGRTRSPTPFPSAIEIHVSRMDSRPMVLRTLSIQGRAKTAGITSTADVQLSEAPLSLPLDWQKIESPEGIYYHNTSTGEVRAIFLGFVDFFRYFSAYTLFVSSLLIAGILDTAEFRRSADSS